MMQAATSDLGTVIPIILLALPVLTAVVTALLVRNRTVRLRAAVAWIAAIVLGAALLLGFVETARLRYYASIRHWPVVTGRVTASEIVGKRAFVPKVTYRYEVNGVSYTGVSDLSAPGFGTKNVRQNTAEKLLTDYPADAPVVLHYEPGNPSNSHLKISAPWHVYARLSFALFLSLICTVPATIFASEKLRVLSRG